MLALPPSLTGVTVGCDVEDVARFVGKASDARFLARVYAPAEIAYCLSRRDPAPHLAARFCAKEACIKALRALDPGLPSIRLAAIEVFRLPGEPPVALLRHPAYAGVGVQISLSHSRRTAMAVALVWRADAAAVSGALP